MFVANPEVRKNGADDGVDERARVLVRPVRELKEPRHAFVDATRMRRRVPYGALEIRDPDVVLRAPQHARSAGDLQRVITKDPMKLEEVLEGKARVLFVKLANPLHGSQVVHDHAFITRCRHAALAEHLPRELARRRTRTLDQARANRFLDQLPYAVLHSGVWSAEGGEYLLPDVGAIELMQDALQL